MIRGVLYVSAGAVLALVLATGVAAATPGSDVRVTTHDLITTDAYASSVGGRPTFCSRTSRASPCIRRRRISSQSA